jgi:cytoskeleton protein RodZ
MSETWVAEGAAFAPPPAANDGVTAGTLLRRAREATGLHVAALAVSLKVPVRKLEALEEDRWDLLTDAVFVRALASSVCRTLKIDPQPVLERLPQATAPRLLRDEDGIGTPYRAPSDGSPPSWLDHVTKPVFLAVFALLLGALVLILLPSVQTEDKSGGASSDTTSVSAPVLIPAPTVSQVADLTPIPPSAMPAPPTETTNTPPASEAAVPVAVPGAVAAPASAPATAASGIVMFRTKGPSWVEVRDAKGVVTIRKLLEAGQWAGASGTLPLQVTVGRVDQTEVQVRGKPFDLGPVAKDNVARFEVK